MLTLIDTIRTAALNWVAYRRTVAELSALPVDTLLDLDIYSGDIPALARDAVYGQVRRYSTPAYRTDGLRFLTNPIHA